MPSLWHPSWTVLTRASKNQVNPSLCTGECGDSLYPAAADVSRDNAASHSSNTHHLFERPDFWKSFRCLQKAISLGVLRFYRSGQIKTCGHPHHCPVIRIQGLGAQTTSTRGTTLLHYCSTSRKGPRHSYNTVTELAVSLRPRTTHRIRPEDCHPQSCT